MKDIYEKFFNKCSEESKKIIEDHIQKFHKGKQEDSNYLYNSVGLPEKHRTIVEKDFQIKLMPSTVGFEIILPFKDKSSFSLGISKNLNFDDSLEVFLLSFLIEDNKHKNQMFKVFYDYSARDGLIFFDSRNYKQDVKNYIDLTNINIVEFIIKNFHNPNSLKDFSGLVSDLDISNDPLFKCIYDSSCMLDKKFDLALKNKMSLK